MSGTQETAPYLIHKYLLAKWVFMIYIHSMAKDPDRRDLFSGALDLMILHSLRVKPMHGYALAKHIKQASDDLLQIEEGSLYPALQRLLREGLLEPKAGISAKGRPTASTG